MILSLLYSFIATAGFGVLFNIRGKKLFWAALGGGLSWFLYLIIYRVTSSQLLSYFAASIAAGMYSELMARLIKAPVTVFVMCSIIALVPGGGMYYTMSESIQGDVSKSLSLGLETMSIAGAIALGILVSSSVVKLATYNKRKNTFKH